MNSSTECVVPDLMAPNSDYEYLPLPAGPWIRVFRLQPSHPKKNGYRSGKAQRGHLEPSESSEWIQELSGRLRCGRNVKTKGMNHRYRRQI